jgi:hypothetical protein
MSCEGSTVEVKYKVDCTNVSALLEDYMIDKNSFEVAHTAACIFFNALAETISASVQKEVITMISEILGLPFPGEETVQGYEGDKNGPDKNVKDAAKALKVSPTVGISEIEKAFEIAKKAIIEKKKEPDWNENQQQEIDTLINHKKNLTGYFEKNNYEKDQNGNVNKSRTKTYQSFINGVNTMAPNIYADGINSKYVIDKNHEDVKTNLENGYQEIIDKMSVDGCSQSSEKTGGKKRSRKKRRMKHLRKTQKGGFSDKDLAELVIPHFFWQMVKDPLREQMTVLMDELMNCEKLKMYIVRSVWENELENIVMKDAIEILQGIASDAIQIEKNTENKPDTNNDEEIIIENMVLLKDEK